MHQSVYAWVGKQVAKYRLDGLCDVFEIGSLNVNGTVRDHFKGEYVGIDCVDGPGVDFVIDVHDLAYQLQLGDTSGLDYVLRVGGVSPNVIVCCEMLEHDSNPNVTFYVIAELLRHGGLALITTRSEGFPLHHEPDYWRFTHDDIKALAYTAGLDVETIEDDPQDGHPGVFAVLRKP